MERLVETLYDENEREILGVSLQEAKKKAKDTYAFAKLDPCRPLVGQDWVPDFSVATSLSEKVFSQIKFLEFGLRHGGKSTAWLVFMANLSIGL